MATRDKNDLELEEETDAPAEKPSEDGDVMDESGADDDPLNEDGGLDDNEIDPFKDKWEE